MSSLVRKIQEAIPQEDAPRKLYYRPHIKWFYNALLVVSLIMECTVLLSAGVMAARGLEKICTHEFQSTCRLAIENDRNGVPSLNIHFKNN